MLRSVFNTKNSFVLLLIIYTAWIWSVFFRNLHGFDDFDVFFNSGKRLLNHEDIYGEPHLNSLKYFYSPSFALLMAALQGLGLFYSKLLWYFINYFALMRMIFILKRYVFEHSAKPTLTLFILLFISGKLTLFNFLSNQMTIVLIWMILESFQLIKKGHTITPMVLMAIGFNIKILPLVALPWLILISKKPINTSVTFIVANIILLFLPALFFGYDYSMNLNRSWVNMINPLSKDHILQTGEAGLLDVSAMITKYLCAEPVKNELSIHLTNIPIEGLVLIINAFRAMLLSLCIWAAIQVKGPIKGIDRQTFILAGLMTLIPLCAPHQRFYSYLFALPMLAIMLTWAVNSRSISYKIFTAVLILVSGLMTWVDFTGEAIVDFFDLYRLTTIGIIVLYLAYIISGIIFFRSKDGQTNYDQLVKMRTREIRIEAYNRFKTAHRIRLTRQMLRIPKN